MTERPLMIRYLADPANAITVAGLVLSIIAIGLVLNGHPVVAVALSMWALLADHLDGVIASRTIGRTPETCGIGKSLDSLADLVSAGIFPGILLVAIAEGTPWSVAVAAISASASALRLSYFNAFGSDGRYFVGIPTSYVLPIVAGMFLCRPLFPPTSLPMFLGGTLVLLAVLQVSRLPAPRVQGVMYAGITSYCVGASVILALRGDAL